MGERLISVVIHHGGEMDHEDREDPYMFGVVQIYRHQDPDRVSHIVVAKLLEGAGYDDVKRIFYKNRGGYLALLDGDLSSRAMTSQIMDHEEVHLFVEHKKSHRHESKRLRNGYLYEVEFAGTETRTHVQRERSYVQRQIQDWVQNGMK